MTPENLSSDNGLLPMHKMSVATRRGVIFVTCVQVQLYGHDINRPNNKSEASTDMQFCCQCRSRECTLAVTVSCFFGTNGTAPLFRTEITSLCKAYTLGQL